LNVPQAGSELDSLVSSSMQSVKKRGSNMDQLEDPSVPSLRLQQEGNCRLTLITADAETLFAFKALQLLNPLSEACLSQATATCKLELH
jgi:hypothetical protein